MKSLDGNEDTPYLEIDLLMAKLIGFENIEWAIELWGEFLDFSYFATPEKTAAKLREIVQSIEWFESGSKED